jgi:hypothetical protein
LAKPRGVVVKKNSTAVLAISVLAVLLAGCGNSAGSGASGNIVTGPNGEMLLVHPRSAQANSVMEAAFDGTLVVGEDDCIIGRTSDGRDFGLLFPAGARFGAGDPPTVEVEGHSLRVGHLVSFGGGSLSRSDIGKILGGAPDQCLREETFYVQTF